MVKRHVPLQRSDILYVQVYDFMEKRYNIHMDNKNRYITSGEENKCKDSVWAWIFLIIGILAAISMRIVVIFMHINPFYAKAAWYVGVTFFLIFFIYRYNVSTSRYRAIKKTGLYSKIESGEPLGEEDRKVIQNILCSLISNKERINFMIIFVLSGITLVMSIVLDILKISS